MNLTYTQIGDYLIPDVTLDVQPERPLGKYGLMRRDYLRKNKPVLWTRLCTSGELFPHCREVEDAAKRRLEVMLSKLAQEAGVTETLKESNPTRWESLMRACKTQAEETILKELVYT